MSTLLVISYSIIEVNRVWQNFFQYLFLLKTFVFKVFNDSSHMTNDSNDSDIENELRAGNKLIKKNFNF